jgi:uncharacterized SAM-binding protein YcdF (DUF218 family)
VDRYSESAPPDAVVVLGAQVLASGSPSPSLRRRVEHGVEVWRETGAGALLVSGGTGEAPMSEAAAMRHLALDLDVPAGRIVVEDRSTSTLEHAVEAAALAGKHGWRRLVIVTDRFHLPRALFLFRRLGLAVAGDPVPTRGGGSRRRWITGALREVPAWLKALAMVAAGRHRRR